MPEWLLIVIQQLPALMAEIVSLIETVNKGTATPEQAAKLKAYAGMLNATHSAINCHIKA